MESYASWRLNTTGGIKYKLIEGPTFVYKDMKELTASEKVLVRSQDLEAFMLELIPPVTVTAGIGIITTRGRLPGTSSLFVQNMSAEPMDLGLAGDPLQADTSAPSNTYSDYYVVTLNFGHSAYDDPDTSDPESFLERDISYSEEVMEIESTKTEVSDGHGSEDTNTQFAAGDTTTANTNKSDMIYKRVPLINLSLRYRFVVTPNWPLLFRLSGKLNSSSSAIFLNAEPQTVLFRGFSAHQEFLYKDRTTQIKPWSFDLQYGIKRIVRGSKVYGWNHYWDPKSSKWRYKLIDGQPPFETDNLALLFT